MMNNDKIVKNSKKLREESESLIESIPRYDEYEGIISTNSGLFIDDTIFEDPEIVSLEDNYRVKGNDKIYIIGGQTISRLKVLRNYSKIRVPNTNNEEALMYSIVRGSYLDEETFKTIASEINYTSALGGKYGILESF